MAPTLLTVYPGDENAAVYAGTGGASFTNLSGTVTVLYADNPAVEFSPDGSISPGASVTLYEMVWLYAATRAEVYVVGNAAVAAGSAIQVTHAWVVGGEIKVPAGTTDSIGAWVASVLAGTTARIVRVHHFIEGGTSATLKLQINGVDVDGLTGLSATTTPDDAAPTTGPDGDLADLDRVKVIVTAVSGAPTVLTVGMTVEYTP